MRENFIRKKGSDMKNEDEQNNRIKEQKGNYHATT